MLEGKDIICFLINKNLPSYCRKFSTSVIIVLIVLDFSMKRFASQSNAACYKKNINFIIESLVFQNRLLNGPHFISGVICPCFYSFYWSPIPFCLGFPNYISVTSGVSLNAATIFPHR